MVRVALAHVHEHDLRQRTFWAERRSRLGFVTAAFENFGEHAIFIPQPAVGIL